jgi:hypothetical protein
VGHGEDLADGDLDQLHLRGQTPGSKGGS